MAMFGSGFRPSMAVSPMDLPPGSPAPAGTMQAASAPAAPKRRGLFGRIGNALFSNPDVLVNLGANIMAASGAPLGQAILGTQQQAREDEELEVQNLYRAALAKKALEPDAQWEPFEQNGVRYQRNTATGEVKAFPGNETAPAGVREWEYRNSLPEHLRPQFDEFRRPVPYGFTPAGIAAQAEIAGRTAAAREPYQNGGGADLRYKNGVPVVTSPEQLKSLPPGTVFIAPDGSRRVK